MKADSTVVHGSTFLVTDDCGRLTRGHDGFYSQDTRLLDGYDLTLTGHDVETVGIASPRPGERVIHAASTIETGSRTLAIRRRQVVTDGLAERVTIENHSRTPQAGTLSLSVSASFDDLFEVRSHQSQTERSLRVSPIDGGVRFAYDAPDSEFERDIVVGMGGESEVVVDDADDTATFAVDCSLGPRESRTVDICLEPGGESVAEPASAFETARTSVLDREAAWRDSISVPDVPDHRWQAVVDRSVADLLALRLETDHGHVLAAGTPWFATAFGRDSLIAAYQSLGVEPALAKGTLRYLAAHQATTVDEYRHAEPGKIFHEIRHGELARTGRVPHGPYYGTLDATALFVVLAHETYQQTGDTGLVDELRPNVEAALDWLAEYGDRDGDGFLEYPTTGGDDGGLTHRAWKDSGDGIMTPSGEHPEGPLAVAEAQGYYYDALSRTADLYRTVWDDADRASDLEARAEDLQAAFDRSFWVPSESFYAIALDGNDEPIPTVSTNPGHCLWSGIVPEDRAEAMVDRLFSPDMYSGWGIRTVSADHDVYNPQSYHLGSVWPHDNSLVLLGLLSYGFEEEATRLASDLLEAAVVRGNDRLPELFAGFDRESTSVPLPYGEACEPQAWAAGTPLVCARALGEDSG